MSPFRAGFHGTTRLASKLASQTHAADSSASTPTAGRMVDSAETAQIAASSTSGSSSDHCGHAASTDGRRDAIP